MDYTRISDKSARKAEKQRRSLRKGRRNISYGGDRQYEECCCEPPEEYVEKYSNRSSKK